VLKIGPREWQEEYEDWDFPPKPKWMRWKTYNRLDEKAQAYEKAADDALLWGLRRILLPGEGIRHRIAALSSWFHRCTS
jgi:hypothetical protein